MFLCERIMRMIFSFIYLHLGPLQPDDFKLSVLLTFSYVKEKLVIFPALKCSLSLPLVMWNSKKYYLNYIFYNIKEK